MTYTEIPRSSTAPPRPDPRLWAGIGSVLIFLVGLALTNVIAGGAGPAPVPGMSLPAFAANPTSAAVNALGQALSGIALVVFASGLARTFGGRIAAQLTASGALAGGTLILSAVLMQSLTSPGLTGQPALAVALFNLAFLIGGPAHVVTLAMLLGSAAIAGRRSGRLPHWLSTFGMVASGAGLLAVLNLGSPLLPFTATAYFIPAGRLLGFVFIVGTVLSLRRSDRPAG